MSMLLAPYNDAMRLGQGYVSYRLSTRTIERPSQVRSRVISGRQEITNRHQVVSYSARVVEKLSDVVESMNISYCSSIKKGNVTVSGSNSTVDEATFKSADVNIVVTVKVTNQTTLIKSNAKFIAMDGIEPGSQMLNDAYGDSYISGFIQGGEFTGIISIKVLDRSNVELTVNKIKANVDSTNDKPSTEFTLNTYDSLSSNGSASTFENTESHIHVAWMGGGQIKNEKTSWDIDSVFAAAAAFPQRVSERPQRTWAILTKYKSNRSFIEWSSYKLFKFLEYDQVGSYTAELFDSYMDYKVLLKYVQQVIDDPASYQAVEDPDALDTSVATLLSVRFAMRKEQAKIIEAIGVLSRDPDILTRQREWGNGRCTDIVSRLIKRAIGTSADEAKPPSTYVKVPPAMHPAAKETSSFSRAVGAGPHPAHKTPAPLLEFDFSSLIPAEFWRSWLPVPKPIPAPVVDTPSPGTQPKLPGGDVMLAIPPP
ncbi:hypothetical protein B0T10DRAFT_363851, partial [Thelonectria olida]